MSNTNLQFISANHAAAIAATMSGRANRGARGFGGGIYPITPQTECIEFLCKQEIEKGSLVRVESEHSAMGVCIGMALSGARTFTASSSNGLAYMAENVRGGLQSIRRGQFEAADALGLNTGQRTGFIVLPQALRVSIPPLVGQAIGTFKETSLVAIIGSFDLLLIANRTIGSQTDFLGVKREGLLFVSAVYFVVAFSMSKYSQRLERKLGVGER